ncbi:MAG: universal stress protein, partial [Chloroflexi bacterium]|nr:universal stress protein [Chloroflexota bacterium]
QVLIRRGWRRARRQHSDLLVVFVETPAWARASPEDKRHLEENLRLAEDLGAEVLRVRGSDVARALVRLAHERNVESLVVGHPRRRGLRRLWRRSTVEKLLRLAPDLDLHIVADPTGRDHATSTRS